MEAFAKHFVVSRRRGALLHHIVLQVMSLEYAITMLTCCKQYSRNIQQDLTLQQFVTPQSTRSQLALQNYLHATFGPCWTVSAHTSSKAIRNLSPDKLDASIHLSRGVRLEERLLDSDWYAQHGPSDSRKIVRIMDCLMVPLIQFCRCRSEAVQRSSPMHCFGHTCR